MSHPTWQQQIEYLAWGDVYPFVLAADITFWTGYVDIDVVLISPNDATSSGYSSTKPIYTRRFPGPQPTIEERKHLVALTMNDVADRLRALLADPPTT